MAYGSWLMVWSAEVMTTAQQHSAQRAGTTSHPSHHVRRAAQVHYRLALHREGPGAMNCLAKADDGLFDGHHVKDASRAESWLLSINGVRFDQREMILLQ